MVKRIEAERIFNGRKGSLNYVSSGAKIKQILWPVQTTQKRALRCQSY